MKAQSNILRSFWFLPILLALSLSASAVDGQIKIAQTSSTTFPIVINQPGSYVLTSNIQVPDPDVNAIEIKARHVNLDLNGHSIFGFGLPGTGTGILASVSSYMPARILNGFISDFGDAGIRAVGAYLDGITAKNNFEYGIYAPGSTITNCTASSNKLGIFADEGSIVSRCRISQNQNRGVDVRRGSTVNNCNVVNNVGVGISVDSNAQIIGNIVRGNTTGIDVHGVHNYIVRNIASQNSVSNFSSSDPSNNYIPTSLTAPDAANANIGW